MLLRLVAWLALSTSVGRVGLGTIFHSRGDAGNPNNHLACVYKTHDAKGRPLRHYQHKILDDRDMVVALPKRYPCLSWVWIYNFRTGLSTLARVGDRGPRHAMIDMSRAVARAIRHNGKEKVLMIPLGGP